MSRTDNGMERVTMPDRKKSHLKILMVGPGRKVRGGITTVVNSYYALGLDNIVDLKYISSMQDGNKVKKLWTAALAYIRFCLNLKKYNIVHIHMAAQASFFRKALFIKKAKKAGKKIIIHQHACDFDNFFLEQPAKKQLEIRCIFSLADKVIALSEEWAEYFGKEICNKDKIIVIHNGVVLPEYQKNDYSDSNVLFLGKLGERKGTYDLLEALPEVLKNAPKASFYLGGDGDIEQCRKLSKKLGVDNHIHFLGWIRDNEKERYFKNCSIFILPSYHEGMPMAVLEAMAHGLATVSTNVGGIPQVIENGTDGIRFDAGNIKKIAEILIQLLNDQSEKKRLGEAGRAKIESRFSAQANINALYNLYQEVGI